MTNNTPHYGHEPIKMREVEGQELEQRGDYYWSPFLSAMWIAIPSPAEDGYAAIRIPVGGKGWSWNKNKPSPTLTPSIHTLGYWHGFVRGGFLVEA